jgi:hypothetical protein
LTGCYIEEQDMRRRTPQEKKRSSLEKDRRNVYGEAPHAARKSIPLRKKLRNRANRHAQEAVLPSQPMTLDADQADEIESSLHHKAPQVWEKYPDAPLAEVLDGKQWRRSTPKADRSRIVIPKPLHP